jgi:hypothetical protein
MPSEVDERVPEQPHFEGEDIRELDALAEAILGLRGADEIKRFLRDLCTRAELEALAHRWLIARLLDEGLPYLTVGARRWLDDDRDARLAVVAPRCGRLSDSARAHETD